MKKPAACRLFALYIFLSSGLHAALEKDLGKGLAYFRVTDATADARALPTAIAAKPSLVLDLRSLVDSGDLASVLPAVLAKTAPAHGVRIILINATTAPALIAAVSQPLPSVITIGPLSNAISPDIAVKTSEEADRAAYLALTPDKAVEPLLNDTRDKRRYDEATLAHDHANGVTTPEEPEPDETDSADSPPSAEQKPAAPAVKTAPPPLIDLVLQHAVHLHRALLALKKL